MPLQKLYCYVDETGQQDRFESFHRRCRRKPGERKKLRDVLIQIENAAATGRRNKSRPTRRLRYLELAPQNGLPGNDVFFGAYSKPHPYFFPMLDVLEKAIKAKAADQFYIARIFVMGLIE